MRQYWRAVLVVKKIRMKNTIQFLTEVGGDGRLASLQSEKSRSNILACSTPGKRVLSKSNDLSTLLTNTKWDLRPRREAPLTVQCLLSAGMKLIVKILNFQPASILYFARGGNKGENNWKRVLITMHVWLAWIRSCGGSGTGPCLIRVIPCLCFLLRCEPKPPDSNGLDRNIRLGLNDGRESIPSKKPRPLSCGPV